jgi:Zn-dependent peptidase ImmA (M78 family)
LDIELVAEKKLNLHVFPVGGIRALIGIDAFLSWNLSDIVVDFQEYMDDRYQNRLRFSIAHEVGHFVLHAGAYKDVDFRSADDYIDAFERLGENAYRTVEWQSNQFAGQVLVPRDELAVLLEKAKEVATRQHLTGKLRGDPGQMLAMVALDLSREFGVSDRVIERRVRDEELWPYGRK